MTRLLMTMTVLLSGCVTAQTPPCDPPPAWASAPDEQPLIRVDACCVTESRQIPVYHGAIVP